MYHTFRLTRREKPQPRSQLRPPNPNPVAQNHLITLRVQRSSLSSKHQQTITPLPQHRKYLICPSRGRALPGMVSLLPRQDPMMGMAKLFGRRKVFPRSNQRAVGKWRYRYSMPHIGELSFTCTRLLVTTIRFSFGHFAAFTIPRIRARNVQRRFSPNS